jgi:hypothetical protein
LSFPANVIPVFGSQRPYVDLNFALGSFGVNGGSVSSLALLSGFTFTRASLAMGYDATGKLTYGPNNLCLQSQTFDNASWGKDRASVTANVTAAPDGTLTADKLTEDTTASNSHRVVASLATTRAPYVFSVYAKADTRSWIYLRADRHPSTTPFAWFDLANGTVGNVNAGFTASMVAAGNGWYRCAVQLDDAFIGNNSFIVGLATGNSVNSYTGDGTSGLYLWGAQIEAVTYQTTPSTYYPTTTAAYYGPRLVYDPVSLASLGILVEEARTNSCIQSQDFNTTWTINRATVTVNNTTSPDGTTNADKLVEDSTAANSHRVFASATTTAAAWTLSVYAKASTRSWVYLRIDRNGGTTPNAFFNLSNCTVGTVEAGLTASIQSVGNGWYRCIITVDTATAASNSPLIGMATSDATVAYNGDGTSGLFIWQAQLEAGTGASSPIPTTTAAVTRAADAVSVTGLTLPAPYTVVSEFNLPRVGTGIDVVNWGSLVNGGGQYITSVSGYMFVRESSATTALTNSGTITANATNKIAARYAVNNCNVSSNGASVGTPDTSVSPPTMSNLGIGPMLVSFGGVYPNGTISRIRVYNSALSDAQLQSLTA